MPEVEEDDGDISQLVNDYIAYSNMNPDVEYYGNADVYVTDGPTEGTYIAVARYAYKYYNFWQEIPTLSEFYLAPGVDGQLAVLPSAPDAVVQSAMDKVAESDTVQEMIAEVQEEYHSIVDIDPDLSAYMESIE